MRDVHIKHFDEKFQYLFSNHPSIKNYAGLAKALSVAPPLVSGWKNGTPYTHPSHIPIRHIGSVCDHLFVSQEVLELEDFQQFKTRAGERPHPSLWDSLVLSAPFSPRLQIIGEGGKRADGPTLRPLTRGIYDPDDLEVDVPIFRNGKSVIIRLDAEPDWHVALFCKDRVGWQRLHPTLRRRETRTDGIFYYPLQNDPVRARYARLDAVPGAQVLVAVITGDALPEPMLEAIAAATDLPSALQHLARSLGVAVTSTSEMIQLRYHVEP